MKAQEIKDRNNYIQIFYMLGFTIPALSQAYDLPDHIIERIIKYGR